MIFSSEITQWYRQNKRDLPWRNTTDPYLIWLSEIILQQTRVDQGMPYYLRFSTNYPNIRSFASANEDEILKHWQGLGYYSRGRNMLKTAIKVMQEHNGKFPTSYNELIKLTGIGEYTAAAISSFSSNEVRAVVDGNVYRLLSRFFGVETPINSTAGKKEFQLLADNLIDKNNPAEYNQAIIEFGALQCKPKNPFCENCPLQITCVAYNSKTVNNLPVKLKTIKTKERYFYYFIIRQENQILIRRRQKGDIWEGLHDFPLIESEIELSETELLTHQMIKKWFFQNKKINFISEKIKHVLTHQKIWGTFIDISGVNKDIINDNNFFWVNINDLDNYAQPKLIFAFLKKYLH